MSQKLKKIISSTYFQITVDDGEDQEIFEIHQEPTAAQKEINDDDPPGPHPWWVASHPFTDGPFLSRDAALKAVWAFVEKT